MYLSGCGARSRMAAMREAGIGLMVTPMMGHTVEYVEQTAAWAADTGCFSQPDKFDLDRYLAWLADRAHAAGTCLFATAPDVVGDAAATLARRRPALARIRALGYRAALVAQDGLETLDVPWDEFDALFIGGSTAWKLGEAAARLAREARLRGKWVHMGRVNSGERMRYAAAIGCDSCDGTYMAYNPGAAIRNISGWVLGARQRSFLQDMAAL